MPACNLSSFSCLRYECQFGPKDRSDIVLKVEPSINSKAWKYNLKVKAITSGEGQKGKRVTEVHERGSIKIGCTCRFYIKRYHFLPPIAEIVHPNSRHLNVEGLVVQD